jgi:geranylgeranyl pyrophosphate synthase
VTTLVEHSTFLADVDAHMRELLESAGSAGDVRDAALRSIEAGGKRLRPILVLAARYHGTPDASVFEECAVRAGAAVELVHTASLVHDDLLDHADMRRGRASVGAAHGRGVATATGDLLFSRAFHTLTETRAAAGERAARAATTLLADVAHRLAVGEALQADQLRDTELDEQAYLERCAGKTGVLFRAALELGALFSGASSTDQAALGTFGEAIGVAFQLTDDVLDCGDDAALLGKQPGADVRDGTITLPMLHAFPLDPTLARTLRGRVDAADVTSILGRIRATGAIESARARALGLRDDALATHADVIDRFQPELLHALADRSVDRIV